MSKARAIIDIRRYPLLSLYAMILVFFNICFAAITPLMGDDFGGVFTAFNYQSLGSNTFTIFEDTFSLVQNGSHVNFLGQLISVAWFKISLTLALNLEIPIVYQYFLLKIFCCLVFVKLLQITYQRIYQNLSFNPIYILLSFLIFFQIRAAWSNDPITSFPFAGTFSGIIILLNILIFHRIMESDKTLRYLLLILVNYLTFMVYEINISVLAYQTCWIFLQYRKNRSQLHRWVLPSFSILISLSFMILTFLFLGASRTEYSGTSLAENDSLKFMGTFVTSLLSLFPFFSWKDSYQLLAEDPKHGTFAIICIIAIFMLTRKLFSTPIDTIALFHKKQTEIDELRTILPIVAMSFSATAIQSATAKLQSELTSPSKVYTYLIPLLIVGVFALARFLNIAKNSPSERIVFPLIALFISIQSVLNLGLNQVLWKEYSENTKLLNSLVGSTTNEYRCGILEVWNDRTWPEYYRSDVMSGLDFYSELERNSPYCKNIK